MNGLLEYIEPDRYKLKPLLRKLSNHIRPYQGKSNRSVFSEIEACQTKGPEQSKTKENETEMLIHGTKLAQHAKI